MPVSIIKEFIEASRLSGATPGSYYQKDPENSWSLWEADLWKISSISDAGNAEKCSPVSRTASPPSISSLLNRTSAPGAYQEEPTPEEWGWIFRLIEWLRE